MLRYVALLLLMLSPLATAGTASITWAMPIHDEDGSLLPADYLVSTTIEYSICAAGDAFGFSLGGVSISVPKTEAAITVATAGRYCFRAYVSGADGEKSAYSNTVARDLKGRKSKAPSIVVTIK